MPGRAGVDATGDVVFGLLRDQTDLDQCVQVEPNCGHMQIAQIGQFGGGHRFRAGSQGVQQLDSAP